MNAINKINKIIDEVRETWTANDGGLTVAAGDLLAIAEVAKKKILSGDKAGAIEWAGSPFDCSTGTEADIISALIEWAEGEGEGVGCLNNCGTEDLKKIRRRVEDRLRKSPSDLIAVAEKMAASGKIKIDDLI